MDLKAIYETITRSDGLSGHLIMTISAAAIFELMSLFIVRARLGKIEIYLQPQLRTPQDPPPFAQILLLILPTRNREHIIGDLEEEYRTSYKRLPRLWYWREVIVLVASYWWVTLRRLAGFDAISKMIRR